MWKKIPGNVPEDPGKCSKRFRGLLEKIPGNVSKDSGELLSLLLLIYFQLTK